MIRRNHNSIEAAFAAARSGGYYLIHRRDGKHAFKRKGDDVILGIAREERARSTVWHLLPIHPDIEVQS